MRDKLKELILEYRNYPQKTCPRYDDETPCDGCKYDLGGECDEVGRLTDHLIANNVFVFPEKLNDSWELCSGFITRMFVANEEELEKIKKEFELQEVKKILTDIRDYLVTEKVRVANSDIYLLQIQEVKKFADKAIAYLTEYAEKLGVEL
jgi:hypothetical protein